MSKNESKARKGKKPSQRLERRDVHKHPTQGTQPYHGKYRQHEDVDPGPWRPLAYVPMVLGSGAAGAGGFYAGAGHVPGPFAGVGPKHYARTDPRILEDVCNLLTAHGELDVADVDVHCRDGIIRLEGSAPDRRTRLMIGQVANSVLGVQRVSNELTVGTAPETS
jgi:hypothetical protein